MQYNLFIDDVLDPIDVTHGSVGVKHIYREYEWYVARNWHEAREMILSLGFPQMVSFDDDLGQNEPSGAQISTLMVNMLIGGVKMPENFVCHVHSLNPTAAEDIRKFWVTWKALLGEYRQ